jgi:NAD-dependent dihydropyrimidine dehydrogenase PreA subunit
MLHFVCTRDEAYEIARGHSRFWVSNCGCREGRGECARSRMDLCLHFRDTGQGSGSGFREVPWSFVEEIFREAKEKRLVTRPFREADGSPVVGGICFCCDDCCGYFLDPQQACDKGPLVARTDMEACTDRLECVKVCHFAARRAEGDELIYYDEKCYGCGLCAEVCPTRCITMVTRPTVGRP